MMPSAPTPSPDGGLKDSRGVPPAGSGVWASEQGLERGTTTGDSLRTTSLRVCARAPRAAAGCE